MILTRPPLLTRTQTPLESAFFLYQKRLEERLAAPFRKGFYFRLDTPSELDWRLKVRERHGVAARDIGRYNPRGRMAWNDEVLVGSPVAEPANVVDSLLRDAVMRVSEDGEEIPEEDRAEIERPLPRRTEADEKGDVRRLDRAMDRTLYLVVRKGEGAPWEFPSGDVLTSENLHEVSFVLAVALVDVALLEAVVAYSVYPFFLPPLFFVPDKPTNRGITRRHPVSWRNRPASI